MATRRTPDSTRSPKPAAAPPTTKSAKTAAEPKSTAAPKASDVKPAAMTVPPTPATATSTPPAKRVAKPKASKAATPAPRMQVSEDTRRGMIAESAYLRAERRGFAPGHEEEDWIAAEREVDALLNAKPGASPQ